MAGIFDYLDWIGPIPLSVLPFNEVDALILNTLSYIHLDKCSYPLTLKEAYNEFSASYSAKEAKEQHLVRVENDYCLLSRIAESERFSSLVLERCKDEFSLEKEIQFAAMTFVLPNAKYIAFRGTDDTIIGWKEDFNLAFSDEVPAQTAAKQYLEEEIGDMPLLVGGHSKGGNLAVYASAKSSVSIQKRIKEIHNDDGPGFLPAFLSCEGYVAISDRIKTVVPRSSIIGMLLDRSEEHKVIKSKQIGIWQHDPYTWQVLGPSFVECDALSESSQLFDKSVKAWLASISIEERSAFLDKVFSLMQKTDVLHAQELIKPKNLLAVFSEVKSLDKETSSMIFSIIKGFFTVYAETRKNEQKHLSGN